MEENIIIIDHGEEALKERYELAAERIREFPDSLKNAEIKAYFERIKELTQLCDRLRSEDLRNAWMNDQLYSELKPENYESSYMNPDRCLAAFGEDKSGILCMWYAEFRGIIPFIHENRLSDVAAILETTIQLYNAFEEYEAQAAGGIHSIMNTVSEDKDADRLLCEHLKDIVYCYIYDYAEEFMSGYIERDQCDTDSFAKNIFMNADLSDTGENSYLYSYGEWITEEEIGAAKLMASLPQETVIKMATAFTEGYIRGFELTGKDISKKSTVICYLPLGFERFMKEAVKQFERAGLEVIINRNPVHLINKKLRGNIRPGFYGAFNRQCEYDHKEDLGLFWGDKLAEHKLQALEKICYDSREALARLSGNACVEIFGLNGEETVYKEPAVHFSEHQLEVSRDYIFRSHDITSRYIPDEETSFTIIAWPTPSIADSMLLKEPERDPGAVYRSIFEKIIEINTLPTDRWQSMQQCMIDALDRAEHVEVKGINGNETDIRISLHRLSEPDRETNFENCLADVNIPAGEVFTSPVLRGTDGLLNVGYVYIGGYLFKDLKITFRDGRVEGYSCSNFADPAENKRLIEKIIFHDREKLPVGEFAIGTNTIAYAAAKQFFIGDKLPVLIAEKTGPHFAVGDTCYSYEEELDTFNPDGKRIIAKENECSALRNEDPAGAYFSVHCDITMPYEELGSITAVSGTERIDIIKNGRFVLSGTEELNEALNELETGE